MAAIRKGATRNSSLAQAADTRVAKVDSAETVSVETAETVDMSAFDGIEKEGLFSEYERNNIGKSGVASARIGKGARVKVDEMITRERAATDAERALAIEIHKAVTGRRVRGSGYVQISVSESARELIVRLSEEREAGYGRSFVGMDRFKAYAKAVAAQKKARGGRGGGGGVRLDVDGARAAAAAVLAAEESQAS